MKENDIMYDDSTDNLTDNLTDDLTADLTDDLIDDLTNESIDHLIEDLTNHLSEDLISDLACAISYEPAHVQIVTLILAISAAWLLKASKRHQVKLDFTVLEVNIKCSACQSLLFRVNEDPLNTYKASNLYRKCESGDAKAAEKEVHQNLG